jgi:hypothetical protein
MSADAAVVDLGLARLKHLEERIGTSESDGLRARWEFGRDLLSRREGKQLPKGLLSAVFRPGRRSDIEYLVYGQGPPQGFQPGSRAWLRDWLSNWSAESDRNPFTAPTEARRVA